MKESKVSAVAVATKSPAHAIEQQLATGMTAQMYLTMLQNMLIQRAVDTRGFQLNRQGKIPIAMGSEGHEAVQAGTGLAFRRGNDSLWTYYRNTGIILACGFELRDLFRSQFARVTDKTKGRQIINHITDHAKGIATLSSIIASQCTHAVGAAYAYKLRREQDRVAFCTFGEGATSQGEWHEALNFASIHQVPVIFICENNEWAISTHQSKQMAVANVASRGAGYAIESHVIDGFDPVAVYQSVLRAREKAASGGGPSLVEAKCYRFLSHTTDDDDRTYRTAEVVATQRERDPLASPLRIRGRCACDWQGSLHGAATRRADGIRTVGVRPQVQRGVAATPRRR